MRFHMPFQACHTCQAEPATHACHTCQAKPATPACHTCPSKPAAHAKPSPPHCPANHVNDGRRYRAVPQAPDGTLTILCVCADVAHARCVRLLSTRTAGLPRLRLREFKALNDSCEQLLMLPDAYGARGSSALRSALQAQCRSYLDSVHTKGLTQLSQLLEGEQWVAVEVPPSVQDIANRCGVWEGVRQCHRLKSPVASPQLPCSLHLPAAVSKSAALPADHKSKTRAAAWQADHKPTKSVAARPANRKPREGAVKTRNTCRAMQSLFQPRRRAEQQSVPQHHE
eukprot:224694-Chlamydomonas_euryale.AAC.1